MLSGKHDQQSEFLIVVNHHGCQMLRLKHILANTLMPIMLPNFPQAHDYYTNPNVTAVFQFHLKVVSQQTATSQKTRAS